MPKTLTKKEVKELMEIPCKSRGEHISLITEETKKRGGEEAVKDLEKKLNDLGIEIELDKVEALEWYPVGIRTVFLLLFKEKFNLTDKDIFNMGVKAVGASFIVKFLFKYFISRKVAFKNIPKYWVKHYTCGKLEPAEFSEKEGEESYYIMRLKDFKIHPILCTFLSGYFLQISKLLGGKKASIEETKCKFSGDPYHEFKVTWKD